LKKLGLVAIAAVAALVLGSFSLSGGTQTAQAEVDDSAAVWCGYFGFLDTPVNACDGLTDIEIEDSANQLGDEDDLLEAGELDDIDLDANQVTDDGAFPLDEIILFAFVDNDGMVTFDADTGLDISVQVDGADQGAGPDANLETCDDDATSDEDCDTATLDDGNGVVTAVASDGTADAGDDVDVDLFQADDTNQVSTENILVVGDADEIDIITYENRIETSGSASDVDDCVDDSDVTDSDQLGDVNRTFVAATVIDNDDVELTRVTVDFTTDDDDVAQVGSNTVVSVDVEAGVAAYAIICGGEDTGTATVTGEIVGGDEDASVEIEVVGAPATIVLTASPAAIACDGTTSSTVTATVTDADGDLVAGLTNVNFSVVALGTANPINFGTVDGVASSQITPLAGAIAGVTVVVTAGDDAESSILISCNTPAAASPTPGGPVPTPTSGGGVTPPDTGNGGYLGQDSSSGFPTWTLIALVLGAFALVGGGMVARRAGK